MTIDFLAVLAAISCSHVRSIEFRLTPDVRTNQRREMLIVWKPSLLLIDRTFGIPSRDYQVDILGASLAIEKCSENGKRARAVSRRDKVVELED